jgi:hypothetical protein
MPLRAGDDPAIGLIALEQAVERLQRRKRFGADGIAAAIRDESCCSCTVFLPRATCSGT